LEVARARWDDPRWATLSVFLRFLSAFHDTHVVREHGAAVAEDVRRQALSFTERLAYAGDPGEFLTDILAWDRTLKARMINPGTSADLTVATLFAQRLRNILPFARNNG